MFEFKELENDSYVPIQMGDHELKSELDTGLYDNLRKLKVELSTYLINDHPMKLIIVGGDEVIHRSDLDESIDTYKDAVSDIIKKGGVIGERGLLPFTYTNIELRPRHVSDLVNYKDVDKFSEDGLKEFIRATDYKNSYDLNGNLKNGNCKAKNVGSNSETVGSLKTVQDWTVFILNIPLEKDLEDNIVHIYEAKPSTNSITLAKQFKIEHRHVIRDLFKLCQSNPSLLMGITFQPYQYIIGKDKAVTFSTYLEVNEDMYYEFINNMGTPKSKEMRIYRQQKMKEYFEAFKILRDDMVIRGYKEQELKRVINNRTQFTSILMKTIIDYTTHRNIGSLAEDSMSYDEMSIIFFNLINRSCSIDAIEYSGDKSNRNELSIALQGKIRDTEIRLDSFLKMGKKFKNPLIESLALLFEVNESALANWLREYGRGDLWDKLTKKLIIK